MAAAAQGNPDTAQSLYEFTANDIKGEPVSLEKYRGHVLMVVNVASKCGYTAQHYKELNELYAEYAESKGELSVARRFSWNKNVDTWNRRAAHFGVPLWPVCEPGAGRQRADWVLGARAEGGVWPVWEGEREWQGGAPGLAVYEEEAGWLSAGPNQVELYQVHYWQGGQAGGATWAEHQPSAAEEESRKVFLECFYFWARSVHRGHYNLL